MPYEVLKKDNHLFVVRLKWCILPREDLSEIFPINVSDDCTVAYALSLKWTPETISPICKLFLKKVSNSGLNLSITSPESSLSRFRVCSVWALFYGTFKHHLTKRPSVDEWDSDLLDSVFAHDIIHENSASQVNLELWIQFETSSETVAILQLHRLLKDQIHCDVYFQFQDKRIGSHVAILAARCPVFAAMFQYDLSETQSREVKIEDIDKDVFYELLTYIYSGQTSNNLSVALAQPLFEAADKYCINDLKGVCLKFLSAHIEVSNVIEILVWAHYHGAASLKQEAHDFMSRNSEEVSKQLEWEDLIRNHFDVLATS